MAWLGTYTAKRIVSASQMLAHAVCWVQDWRKRVQGDEGFDLHTVSPLFTIDRLKVPILMMHGDADQRVPYKQSKLYADALRSAGKSYEFYTLQGEGHGFSSSENEQQWFDRLEAFLARYNPAD